MSQHKPAISKPSRLHWKRSPPFAVLLLAVLFITVCAGQAFGRDANPEDFNTVGTIWLVVAAMLVFFMNAGFAMLETGFCRAGNAVNVLAKNLTVFCVATLAFWLFGFRFMFGDSSHSLFGQIGLFLEFSFPSDVVLNPFPPNFEALNSHWEGRSFAALFFFQLVFSGTSATIVSGAVAERLKFWAFLLFSFVLVGFIYPLVGYWVWGGGWLSGLPLQFRDFAGSTVVHSVGGTAALVGAILARPRQGRFGYDASHNAFTGPEDPSRFDAHSLSLATLGCFILWLGWFGFNGGSTTRLEYVPHILLTTLFAAAGGGSAVILSPFITDKKARLSSIINGILGGLVGITASSAYVNVGTAIIIGGSSGLLVLVVEKLLVKLRIDDPVGAIPVHLACGAWGTLAVGLFGDPYSSEYQLESYSRTTQILYQAFGWTTVFLTVGILSFAAWVSIGLILYVLSPKKEIVYQVNKTIVRHQYLPNDRNAGLVPYLFSVSRQGLRVPLAFEEKGGTPTLLP